jgi:HK97 family phage major capsid protein
MLTTDLTTKKDALRSEMKGLLDHALRDKRELSKDETTRFDTLDAEVKGLQATLDRAKTLEDLTPPVPVLPVVHDTTEVVDAESRVLSRDESVRAWVEKQAHYFDDYGRLRLGEIMRAMVLGPQTDRERRALAESGDATGGITVPDLTMATFIDKLRAAIVCVRAGARTVPLQSDVTKIARLATDPVVAWRAENAAVAESDPTFEGVTFAPKSLDVMFKISRELFEDSINITDMLETALLRAFAVEIDRACLFGSGTTNQPLGLRTLPNVNQTVMATTGLALTSFDKPIDALATLWTSNVPNATAMLMAPRTLATISKLREGATTGQQLIPPAVLTAFPWLQTTSIPVTETQGAGTSCSTMFFGDFAQMMLGMRTTMQIEVARELFRGNYQFGFFGHMRMDMQVTHPEAFARLIGILP